MHPFLEEKAPPREGPLPPLPPQNSAKSNRRRWFQTAEQGANGAGDPQKSPHVLNGLLAEGKCRGRGHRAGRLGRLGSARLAPLAHSFGADSQVSVPDKSFVMTPTLEVIPDSVRVHNAGSCWACAGR